jgi:POT family proton-dependent oligopeptide transporter
MGITIPTSMFVLVPNSIFIILLASLFAKIWLKLAEKGNNPSAPVKFLIGLLFTLASFITFTLSAYLAYTSGVASSMLWPLVGIFLLTCAELCISPVGLSIVSEMSPKHLSGFLMGAWFLASSIGSYVSGLLSSFVHIPRGMNNVIISAHAYFNLFSRCSLAMAIVIIIFILLLPLIKRLTNKNLI